MNALTSRVNVAAAVGVKAVKARRPSRRCVRGPEDWTRPAERASARPQATRQVTVMAVKKAAPAKQAKGELSNLCARPPARLARDPARGHRLRQPSWLRRFVSARGPPPS